MADEIKSASEKKKEDWMNSKWRPMMGWLYMTTCTFDFIIFPVLWSLLQATTKGQITQWQPLTLQGAGLYHVAMGAVLGLAAFGRTQEKIAGANNGGIQAQGTGFTGGPPTYGSPSSGFNGANSFSSPATFTPAPSWGTTPTSATTNFVPAPAVLDTTASGKKIVPDFGQPLL